ncbi:MAG TPA: hypothetical protein VLW45_08830, partial [Pelomicrobium sp.]|nr:hypothetical protein [Pelomicrobium sp.]
MTDIEYLVRRIFELETRRQRVETLLVAATSSQVAGGVTPSPQGRRASARQPLRQPAAGASPPAKTTGPVRIEARAALEEFPHVVKNLSLEWGYPECEAYIAKLVIDERGNRRGFSMEVMDELLFLSTLLRSRSPKLRLEATKRRFENPR